MPLVNIKNFGNGIAEDYANPRSGEFSIVKHFDVLTFPNRLHPLRGMTTTGEPTNSLLGNIIVASNGLFYGIGEDPGNAGKGELWTKAGFGTTDFWRQMTSSRQLSGQGVQYNFLVDYQNAGGVRKIFWSGINILVVSDEDGNSSEDTDALSHINIRQGIVHPKDKILYFTYNTSTQYFIGKIATHASDPFGNTNYTAFELPFNDVAHTLSYFGDFLAVPLTNLNPGGDVQSSKLGL